MRSADLESLAVRSVHQRTHGDLFFVPLKGGCVRKGRLFRLSRPTVAIHLVDGTKTVVSLPANAVVKILSGPDANGEVPDKGIVYAAWEDRTVAMFIVDLEIRGIEVWESEQSASA